MGTKSFSWDLWPRLRLSAAEGKRAELRYLAAEGWRVSATAHNPALRDNQRAHTSLRLFTDEVSDMLQKEKDLRCHTGFLFYKMSASLPQPANPSLFWGRIRKPL